MSALTKNFFEKKINFFLFFSTYLLITLYLFEVIIPFFIAFMIAYFTNPFKSTS